MPTVIHVSPHPDDESIAAPCALLTLRDAGWDVVNFACSLGREADHDRRGRELDAALGVAGFKGERAKRHISISRGDNLQEGMHALRHELTALVHDMNDVQLVVGPHPRDGHHGHATVARAIRQLMWTSKRPLTWWMWSIWSDLPRPTLLVECTDEHLAISQRMLDQYAGENERNDYRVMHLPIREVNAVRGAEKMLGYGSAARQYTGGIKYAELFTEIAFRGKAWRAGVPRILDTSDLQRNLGTRWEPLDDFSLLSSTRLRPFYRPILFSAHSRLGWKVKAPKMPNHLEPSRAPRHSLAVPPASPQPPGNRAPGSS